MKTSNAVLTGLAVAVVVAGLAWAIDVDVSGETKLPTVEVTEEGQMPDVAVDTVDIDVTRGERTINVPTVDMDERTIEMQERTIPFPEVDVTHPDASAAEEVDADTVTETFETEVDGIEIETEVQEDTAPMESEALEND